jgi:protoporphyrinogen oxidase
MYVITGTGISSLFLADLLIRKNYKGESIILIESSNNTGGLFGMLKHDEYTTFDIGMHTVQFTGNSDIDEIIESIYSDDDWYRFKAPLHDISGTIIGNKVFENGPYFHLDYFEEAYRNNLISELKDHLRQRQNRNEYESTENMNASSFLVNRFGKNLADATYIETLQKRYQISPDDLGQIATTLTPMNRLSMKDVFSEKELLENEEIRSVIAWPNQRDLPLNLSSNRDVIYPRKNGIHLVIDKLQNHLAEQGVKFLTNSKIVKILKKDKKLRVLCIEQQLKSMQIDVDHMFWSGNISSLITLLEEHKPNYVTNNPLQTVIATIKAEPKSIRKSDCLYFFSYLPTNGLYRLNNYAAYHDENAKKNQGLLSMEYLIPKEVTLNKDQVIKDLVDFDFVDNVLDSNQIKIHFLPFGHPYPSLANIYAEDNLLREFLDINLTNIDVFGSSLSRNRFFQKDVLQNLTEVVTHV